MREGKGNIAAGGHSPAAAYALRAAKPNPMAVALAIPFPHGYSLPT